MALIITICTLILLAYVFELTSAKTKVPSVILLLLLGWIVRQLTTFLEIDIPDLEPILPILGTVGLILIVLEGSLELEFNKSKAPLIKKSVLASLLPMIVLSFGLSYMFQFFGQVSLRDGLINAIPFCIISSAIAIPSVKMLASYNKEFVIYESSMSDIFGVLFFNFVTLNTSFGYDSIETFFLQLIIIIFISFIATVGLAFLLNKIDHHIKFAPIIILVILIYAISKVYHLPGLIFILLFGLFLGNLDEMKRFKWIEKLNPDNLNKEVSKFKELTIEATFLIRALFFLLFGFLIQISEIINTETLVWAVGIVATIFLLRAGQLKISKLPLSPLLYIAPRGLITILLFLAIAPSENISFVNKSLIIQVMILTSLIMMFGLLSTKAKPDDN